MYQSRNENLVPLPSLWTKSVFLSPHLPKAISCLKASYTHYMKCHSEYLSQVKVHLQLGDSFKGVISIQRWIPLGDIKIPAIKLIALDSIYEARAALFQNQTMWHLLLAIASCLSVIVSLTFEEEWEGVANIGIFLTFNWLFELFS